MKTIVCSAAAVLAITLCLGVLDASEPIALYALADKVALEPNADKPERIRISGVFITVEERSDVYSAPQRGYLYFGLPRGNEELARRGMGGSEIRRRHASGGGTWIQLGRESPRQETG
jgi:hypothetical protein